MASKAWSNQWCGSRDVIIIECVDIWRGCSFILQWVYIDIFITNVFHPNNVIDTERVDRRRCSVVSLYPHIEVIACTRGFLTDVIVTECVDRRRCSVISLYPHINIAITYSPRQHP